MASKKIAGWVFVIIATLLTLAIIGQLPQLFGSVVGFYMIFTGKLDASQTGNATGHIIYWVFHFAVTIALWKYGVRWIRKQPTA
jgi:hypothetical protein